MEIKKFNDYLYDLALTMKDEEKIELIYEYPDYHSELIYHNNKDEINSNFGSKGVEMIIDANKAGQYNYNHPYFTIDGYGYIQTFENINDYFDIYEIMKDNSDMYLEDYKNYLSDVLYGINNKEDVDKFKEIITKENLLDYFEEELNEKKINNWNNYKKNDELER